MTPLPPSLVLANGRPTTLGVLGGGQLGRMFVHTAQRMGYRVVVLDPDPESPAGLVSHQHIQAEYDDPEALAAMVRLCDAVTVEFENLPAAALQSLTGRVQLAPGARAVEVAQSRMAEKAFFAAHAAALGVGPGPYVCIERAQDWAGVPPALFPGILKTARLGYDGKGQQAVVDVAAARAAWSGLHEVPCVLEQALPLRAEYSLLVARGADGQCVMFPPQHNVHRHGILARTEVDPHAPPPSWWPRAVQAAQALAAALDYVGVLCLECFLVDDGSVDGRLVLNEMAPRPHNSGHHSIDACDISQFELQVRAMAGLPLAAPRLMQAAVMVNLLGDLWLDAKNTLRQLPWAKVLAVPGVKLHLYGKTEARAGRKMGHLTVLAHNLEQARARAQHAQALLGMGQ
jgi:5-(carboxyamino)imidazole ribonucleotide synthase